mgnify:CR=1 FL=1
MSGQSLPLRKGERVPRRPLPKFEEVEGGLLSGITAHGWRIWRVALDDENQYGPHAMILCYYLCLHLQGLFLD